jgi:nitrous oxidase accessory protein
MRIPGVLDFAVFLLTASAAFAAPGFDLQSALDRAPAGSVLTIPAGTYKGKFFVRKPLELLAEKGAEIVYGGNGEGSALTVEAGGVTLRGIAVSGSGTNLDALDACVTVRGTKVRIENCDFRGGLFCIVLDKSDGAIVRGNRLTGDLKLSFARRGDGVRVQGGRGALLLSNVVETSCDGIYFDSATNATATGNFVSGGRYGLHLMHSEGVVALSNLCGSNIAGCQVMDSRGARVEGNVFFRNRGSHGAGLQVFDSSNCVAMFNELSENTAGVSLKDTGSLLFLSNRISANASGVRCAGRDRGVVFSGNRFAGNVIQIDWKRASPEHFEYRGVGNFWDDYRGFDMNGDGRGDGAYRQSGFFAALVRRSPNLGIFFGSPASFLADFADLSGRALDRRPLLK